ncbi:MAG: glycosyltransferase [Deltaproteobacteria bacterium]
MNIAFINDWVVDLGGAENLLQAVAEIYPQAPLYTLFYDKTSLAKLGLPVERVHASRLQKRRNIQNNYRSKLPWFPYTIEQFDLSDYDVLLSLSHCVAKGVLTRADQLHICYCHTPVRYAWDLTHNYLAENGLDHGVKAVLARWFLHYLRLWDSQSSNRVDYFIANSQNTSRRIWRAYRREAQVIYPPIDLSLFQPGQQKEDYFIFVSRLVPYKKALLVIQVFNQLGLPLKVVGTGPELGECQKIAGPKVEILGYRSGEELAGLMGRARALLFAAEEDFGMVPVEAQASGTPVIALGRGGVVETVVPADGSNWAEATGIFFYEQSIAALKKAVEQFIAWENSFRPEAMAANVRRFGQERFKNELQDFINIKHENFHR